MADTKSDITSLSNQLVNKGFKKILSELSLLKDVLARLVDDINRVKGFQNVMIEVLEDNGLVDRVEFEEASYEEYRKSVVDELHKFVKTYMSDDVQVKDYRKTAEELKDYYDKDGKPKAKA